MLKCDRIINPALKQNAASDGLPLGLMTSDKAMRTA